MADTDRELLELAAKAAGITGTWQDGPFPGIVGGAIGDVDVPWNPLRNDGQGLRLAVRLNMHVIVDGENTHVRVYARHWATADEGYGACGFGQDKDAATRRAIVRAAAEIGRAMNG